MLPRSVRLDLDADLGQAQPVGDRAPTGGRKDEVSGNRLTRLFRAALDPAKWGDIIANVLDGIRKLLRFLPFVIPVLHPFIVVFTKSLFDVLKKAWEAA